MAKGNKFHKRGENSLTNSEEKKRRRESAEAWKSTRGEEGFALPTSNVRFEAFYRHLLKLEEPEWQEFMTSLKAPLPACFHINPDFPFTSELKRQLHEFAGQTIVHEGKTIEPVKQLPWYPHGCGFQFGTDRRTIRKCEVLDGLHKWLMQHTENGNLTRQEAVSMVPPLALNVQPHHKCFDMCAAPGSKTSQLLEIVNRSLSNDSSEQGLVVANDADTERAYMLVHQCRRINSPLLVITTHKGQMFPRLYNDNVTLESSKYSLKALSGGFFDRVLCDVPCSGDGTLRKNPAIWSKWNLGSSVSLHPLQLLIAQRGLQLLKPGGLIVYSTCSMSPYEDESVVAELLRLNKDTLELVDAREFLPLFRCREGLSYWDVLDDFDAARSSRQNNNKNNGKSSKDANNNSNENNNDSEMKNDDNNDNNNDSNTHNNDDNNNDNNNDSEENENKRRRVEENNAEPTSSVSTTSTLENCHKIGMHVFSSFADVPPALQRKYRKSLFPPTEEEKQWMHLEKCMRCLPHDENTGGFFVATFRKKELSASTSESTVVKDNENENEVDEQPQQAEEGTEDVNVEDDCNACAADGDDKPAESDKKPQQKVDPRQLTRGLVDFQLLDKEAFDKIKAFYGVLDSFDPQSLYMREDFIGNGKSKTSKSIFYMPESVRSVLKGDRENRLKIVSSGVKVFEKKVKNDGDIDYRLVQEGLSYIVPHISARLVQVTIQDLCNMLEGGLVSYSTLSDATIASIAKQPSGALVAQYRYTGRDVVAEDGTPAPIEDEADMKAMDFFLISWKGSTRTLNVMCPKGDMDSMKHQLKALKVFRPKIAAAKKEKTEESTATSEAVVTEAEAVNEENKMEE